MKAIFLLQVLVLFIGLENVQAQTTTDIKQQFMSLGDFSLENGQKILDCKIGYRTFGKPNADKSNAIIFLCGLGETTAMLQNLVPGIIVDTTKFYLILIDAIGNGHSSSPSNSTKQPRLEFPQFTIKDMVESQYKMLTEKMGIHHLAAVSGMSMGGLQTLQWAVSHPDFMEKHCLLKLPHNLLPMICCGLIPFFKPSKVTLHTTMAITKANRLCRLLCKFCKWLALRRNM